MAIEITALQRQRIDTAANWAAENPILLDGEIGYERDTSKLKIGDGITAWNLLAYTPWSGVNSYPFVDADVASNAGINKTKIAGTAIVANDVATVTNPMLADGIDVAKLTEGTANQLLHVNAAGTTAGWTSDIDIPGTLDVTGVATFDTSVIVEGNLTVNGTTTTIDSQTLLVEDKNIEMGVVASPTDITADGGGITLRGSTNKTINWVNSIDSWTSSEHVNLLNGKEFKIDGIKVLDAVSLGTGITGSSLTSVGTIGTGVWQGSAIDVAYLDSTVVTTADSGTVTGAMIVDGTIQNADVNAAAAIAGTKIDPDFGSQDVLTTGNAGIGTTNPQARLHISSGANGDCVLRLSADTDNNNENDNPVIEFEQDGGNIKAAIGLGVNNATDDNSLIIAHASAGTFASNKGIVFKTTNISDDYTDAVARMVLDNDGNLGLGTDDPGASLHINGNVNPELRIEDQGEYVSLLYNDNGSTLSVGVLNADNGNTSVADTELRIGVDGVNRYVTKADGSHTFYQTNGSTESMLIDSSGRVGVGTTSPSKIFQASNSPDTTNSSNGANFIIESPGLTAAQINATTNGLGTSGMGSNFGGDYHFRSFWGFSIDKGAGGLSSGASNSVNSDVRTFAIRQFAGGTTWNTQFCVNGSGNVGIGITPTCKLHINTSTTGDEAFRCQNAGGVERVRIELGSGDTKLIGDNSLFTIRSTDNALAFNTTNFERARFDTSGRLLVGTPIARSTGTVTWRSQIEGAGELTGLGITTNQNSAAGAYLSLAKSRGSVLGSNTIVQDGDGLGYILFSGADGTDANTQGGLIGCEVDGTPGVDDMPGRLVFSTRATGASSPTERMRITNNGNVNWTSTGENIPTNNVTGTSVFGSNGALGGSRGIGGKYFTFYNFSNSAEIGSITNNGGTGTLYNTSSDYRLKENVVPLTGAADRVNQLQACRFNFIADADTTVDGFLAHEAQTVVPEAVTGTKDEVDDDGNPVYQGIDQSKLVPLLTAALQEALAKIETLEQRLSDAGIA